MSMTTPKTSSSPSVTVTLDELARAIHSMGPPTISAGLLYHAILHVQAHPYTPHVQPASEITPAPQATEPSEYDHLPPLVPITCRLSPEEKTHRRKLKERALAAFPNGFPDPYWH